MITIKTIFNILLAIIIGSALIAGCSSDKESVSVFDTWSGVWAGDDCEIVRTPQYEIVIWRDGGIFRAELRGMEISDTVIIGATRGEMAFDSAAGKMSIIARDLVDGINVYISLDSAGLITLTADTLAVDRYPDSLVFTRDGEPFEVVDHGKQSLRRRFGDNDWRELVLVEKIEIASPYTMPAATADNIGQCLQMWELGTRRMLMKEQYVTGITINTNRHSAIWYYDGNVFYARTARLRSNNNGSLFAQNIRLMYNYNTGEMTTSIADYNRKVADAELVIIDSLFNPDVCIYAPDGIYWSLKSNTPDKIVINGCGQDYFRDRPDSSSPDILEWFEYKAY